MTIVRTNVVRKIKTAKEKYIRLPVANTVQPYQITVSGHIYRNLKEILVYYIIINFTYLYLLFLGRGRFKSNRPRGRGGFRTRGRGSWRKNFY